MNKKITIVIVIIILLITAFTFIVMWESKNKTADESNVNLQETAIKPPIKTDSDVKAIEDDLKAVDESDFDVSELSDENVGL